MAGKNSLKKFLVSYDRSFKDIKSFLERDPSSINEQDDAQRTPLFYVLKSKNCSKEIVRLFLDYGASIDARDKNGETPLIWALKYNKLEAVITELIEKGANVNVQDTCGDSPLCIAFSRQFSKEVVESLLKTCRSLPACCIDHETVWHCLTEFGLQGFESGYFEDVANLVIQAGADVNKVDYDGQSPLCHVLFKGDGVGDIKLLLSNGASFNDCRKHGSPMLCITDGCSREILKADVVELLLKEGASVEEVNEEKCTPLQLALRYCRHETAAITMLLNHACKNNNLAIIKHEWSGNLLHFAVSNPDCKLIIVKFLLKQGVRSDEINEFGRTPLHEAMRYDNRDLRIIKLLVNNGSPVNVKCKNGYTPLSLAVESQMQCNVLYVLLEAGAFVHELNDIPEVNIKQTLEEYCEIDRSKILIKWLLIENPSFDIRGLTEGHPEHVEFISFTEECLLDLQRMESVNVGLDLTLSEFIKRYPPQNVGNCEPKLNVNLDQLLQAISMNQFLIFFDVISSKISKLLLMEKLQQLSVYTWNIALTKVVCNYDCLWKIAKYLTRKDLLCLILAFYFTCDYSRNS